MNAPIPIYVFRFPYRPTVACIGPRDAIEKYLDLASIDVLFFGYVQYRADDGSDLVGVWGRRNASRMRRLLRERGATLAIRYELPAAKLHHSVTHPGTRTRQKDAA